jgi:hypothetical protein
MKTCCSTAREIRRTRPADRGSVALAGGEMRYPAARSLLLPALMARRGPGPGPGVVARPGQDEAAA